ncbi:hypothetical protein LJR009_004897 [Bosea sp. LjRoot9]|uniref:hypothetical protein n=1 Tax=Bosea sp. LjRoot9 TaxID=3342341 RepID=UPI003ECCE43F
MMVSPEVQSGANHSPSMSIGRGGRPEGSKGDDYFFRGSIRPNNLTVIPDKSHSDAEIRDPSEATELYDGSRISASLRPG